MADEKVYKIIKILRRYYGRPNLLKLADPLDELIVTILSQNTNWQNTYRAFRNLKKRFKNWNEAYLAKASEIAKTIKTGGLANVKSKVIKAILKRIKEDHKSPSLKFLKNFTSPEVWEYLNSLKGVGPKTASCVMLFSLEMPALPVDTHILRVSKRLGLIDKKTTLEQAHGILTKTVGKNLDDLRRFHINMIVHGRKICSSQNPKCSSCPLKSQCRYFLHHGKL